MTKPHRHPPDPATAVAYMGSNRTLAADVGDATKAVPDGTLSIT